MGLQQGGLRQTLGERSLAQRESAEVGSYLVGRVAQM